MRLWRLAAMGFIGFAALKVGAAPGPWQQPAAALADQIAEILGPGQARITVRNLSAISADDLPAIRGLIERDLKSHGIVAASDPESANTVRITLSEDARQLLWIAEVVEGSETRIAMVPAALDIPKSSQLAGGMTLRRQAILNTHNPLLATLETAAGLVTLEPEQIVIYTRNPDGWQEQKRVNIEQRHPLARDPRGILVASADGNAFEAFLARVHCRGSYVAAQPAGDWQVQCNESDDPWPVPHPPATQSATGTEMGVSLTPITAFYNAARDYFTGVTNLSPEMDLPPFYSAVQLPRSNGTGLLIGGIDGKVQLVDAGPLKPITGTRDWGSDFGVLHSGCGSEAQIIASGSGEAVSDSLRAYELPAREAVPASPPLAVNGTVTALWPAPDSKSVFAVIRNDVNEYEVDRVTASCN
ncbi:MAG TPA: hypothetical protein VFE01_11275 [Terracidiphilus sp.]|nr:hypothetical protein [Terracidiphilus sp.]